MSKSKSSSSSSMNDAYTSLELSIEKAKTWTPKIIFPSTQLKLDDNTCTINENNINSDIDIVKLLSLTSTTGFNSYATDLQYPTGAIFQFEGFNGVEQKDELKNHIISTAQQYGTSLSVYQSHNRTTVLHK